MARIDTRAKKIMPRVTPAQEFKLISEIVGGCPDGIGIVDIQSELSRRCQLALTKRTLQRRLRKLIDSGALILEGGSSAIVYKSPTSVDQSLNNKSYPVPEHRLQHTPAFQLNEPEGYVTMSPEGAAIREYVRRPIMHRQPVGYQRDFLDRYEPGETFYLPVSSREQLHEMGRTSNEPRPAGTYARDILNRLLVDLSWASSRLEGNTYSHLDTQNLIEFGQVVDDKDAWQAQMILNHKAAIEFLVQGVDEVGLDRATFLILHALLSEDLLTDADASGRLRRRPVDISGSVFVPLAIPQMIEECFEDVLAKAQAIADPFEQAFFLMVHLPYLQPFEDVNKRVSRIGANLPFIEHNLCPLSFVNVPERAYFEGLLGIYELNQIELMRDVFVWAYQRSCQQYLAVVQSTVAPDPMKLKYRQALRLAVQQIVLQKQWPTPQLLTQYAQKFAEPADHDKFVQMLGLVLDQLHEYSAARYQLRRGEFWAWKQVLVENS